MLKLAEPVEEMLKKVSGIVDVVGVQRGNPVVTWTIDPATAGRYGLPVEQTTQIRSADGKAFPLSAVATPIRANGQGELRRENLRPMAVVSGRLEDRDLGSAIAEIRSKVEQLKLPIGYTYEVGGQYDAQRQAFRELLMVFALAVVLVFATLVIHFQAWLPATLIMLAAPLSLSGALLVLCLTGVDLNISSAMGLILLVGLVVKNGIMLLDFSEKLHAE